MTDKDVMQRYVNVVGYGNLMVHIKVLNYLDGAGNVLENSSFTHT